MVSVTVSDPATISHVVAMPYPGRGHINPLLNFCKLIARSRPDIIVTFIVTEEWHGFLSSDEDIVLPSNLRLTAIPQVIPSEIGRGKDWPGFLRATLTKLEGPVAEVLDRLVGVLPKPCVIIFDTYMKWVVEIGSRRNIPVASYWTQSATVFSIFHHFDLLAQNHHFNVDVSVDRVTDAVGGSSWPRGVDINRNTIVKPGHQNTHITLWYPQWPDLLKRARASDLAKEWSTYMVVLWIYAFFDYLLANDDLFTGKEEELVDYIPGVASMRVADLPTAVNGKGKEMLPTCLDCVSLVSKSQFLLFTSTYELEAQVIDHLRKNYSIPVYSIGPAIPYRDISSPKESETEYMKWLDAQPTASVIYISQGSFLSVSTAQLDEIVAGVCGSGVRFLWISRDETIQCMKEGDVNGIVVPWCNQLRVLSHSSIGGFWSHCGWNSTKEGLYAGVPMLCFPIFFDQVTNTKHIVDDWKTGWRMKRDDDSLITSEEIAKILRRFMDSESEDGKELRRKAKEWRGVCVKSVENGGSSCKDVEAFIDDITI